MDPHQSQKSLKKLHKVAHLLDEAFVIPGTQFRFGWDGILGLVPGAGDFLTTVLSLWIVVESLSHHVPAMVAVRMIGNILIENTLSVIPLVGDVFDFVWKANTKNLELLTRYKQNPGKTQRNSTLAILAIIFLALCTLILAVIIPLWFVFYLIQTIGIGSF